MSLPRHLPPDPALPRLAQALDEAAMGAAFDRIVRAQGRGLHVDSVQVERIKYRPRRNCTLSYRLQLRSAADHRVFEQRVAARLCSAADVARRAARALQAPTAPTLAGPTVCVLPALDLLTWWWPNDPKLAAPSVLADMPLLRAQVLPGVVAAMSEGRGTLVDFQVDVAQYVPEHRLCARVDLQWQAAGERVARTVYAKASREPDGATAHGFLRALQSSAAVREGRLKTPRALLWQPAFDLHWQEGLPGRALLDLDAAAAARLAVPLGAQLAALHGTPLPAARVLVEQVLRARLDDVLAVLNAVLPAARPTLRRVASYLAGGMAGLDSLPQVTLHGDLHARNILADGAQLAFIDLDGLRRGPAVLELGAWMADGMYRALLDNAAPQRDNESWQSLLAGYARAGGTVPAPQQLAWAVAWNLLCQRAWRCVINLKPGRFALAPRLIELAGAMARSHHLEAA